MQRAARIAFVFAAVLAFVMAASPRPLALPGDPSDKIVHMLAFATLGVLSAYGFRDRRIGILFFGLSGFGALIEAVQAIPALRRDSEILDLIADMIAALAALALTRGLMAWRERGKV